MQANEASQKVKSPKKLIKKIRSSLFIFITILFYLLFLLSMFPLVGNTVGWLMLAVSLVLFLMLFVSPLSTTLTNMFFLKNWFRYSLYAVLIGLVAFAGCNLESKKRLKEFIEKNQKQKIEMENLLQKGNR